MKKTRNEYLETFRHHCIDSDLKARVSRNTFYKIDGSSVCNKCASSKRKTLYLIIADNSVIIIKCFRASCQLELSTEKHVGYADNSRARALSSMQDFKDLGFNDEEAIRGILDTSSIVYSRIASVRDYDNKLMIDYDVPISTDASEYFKLRTGMVCDRNTANKYGVIPDISAVLSDNDIQLESNHRYFFEERGCYVSKFNSISFIMDNNYIFTRKLPNSGSTSSFNMSIIHTISDDKSSGYVLNPSNSKEISTLVIAEGMFDIINAEHIFANGIPDTLYVATTGWEKTAAIIEDTYINHITTLKSLIIFMDSDIMYDGLDNETSIEEEMVRCSYKVYLVRLLFIKLISKGIDIPNVFICYNKTYKDIGDMSKPIDMEKIDVTSMAEYIEINNPNRGKSNNKYYNKFNNKGGKYY